MVRKHLCLYAAGLLALTGVTGCSSSDTPAAPNPAVVTSGSVLKLSVTVAGTSVTPAPAQVDLAIGQTLELTVTSDHADELHAHGFEVETELKAGTPATIRLTGKEAGVYPVETHEPELTLLTVAVR